MSITSRHYRNSSRVRASRISKREPHGRILGYRVIENSEGVITHTQAFHATKGWRKPRRELPIQSRRKLIGI